MDRRPAGDVRDEADHQLHVLVTGVTSGIGLELATLFAAEGASIIGTGRRPAAEVPPSLPPELIYVEADQTAPDVAGRIRAAVVAQRWTHIDHLVLNAGIGFAADAWEERPESIDLTLRTNLLAPMLITQAFADLLDRSPSRSLVTLIGSTARHGAPRFASYAASKAGLAGFARALASEWRDRVDVQLIDPGPTATGMHEKAGLETGFARRFFVTPETCARRIRAMMATRRRRSKVSIGFRELMQGLTPSKKTG